MLCGGNMSAFLLILLGIAFMIMFVAFVLGLGVLMMVIFPALSFGLCTLSGIIVYSLFMGIIFKLIIMEASVKQ